MKKKLLTAVILSASCLFASAYTKDSAIGYVSLDNGSLTTSDGVNLSGDTTSGYTLTLKNGGVWTGTSESGTRDDITFACTIDFSKIDFDTADMRFFYVDGSRADLGIGWDVETKCVTATWGSDFDIQVSGIRATGLVTFVFTMGDGGARIYQNSGSGFWTKTNVKGDLGTVSSLVVSAQATEAIDNLVVWNKDIAFSGGNASVASAFQALTSLIPEPSAFGLLAGLGALSLVASRRRRR
ncbi:MAG: PEP-CTERM sorting domain-containing protein [Opitutales bacterium]|nr:PEP-CTERM sorting domain-containing protein [Opitutales bacterium]